MQAIITDLYGGSHKEHAQRKMRHGGAPPSPAPEPKREEEGYKVEERRPEPVKPKPPVPAPEPKQEEGYKVEQVQPGGPEKPAGPVVQPGGPEQPAGPVDLQRFAAGAACLSAFSVRLQDEAGTLEGQ